MTHARPNNTDEQQVTINAAEASVTPQQCRRLIACMTCCTDAVICAKGKKSPVEKKAQKTNKNENSYVIWYVNISRHRIFDLLINWINFWVINAEKNWNFHFFKWKELLFVELHM